MGLTEKKVLMVIANQSFRDEEYAEPRKIFEENGIKIIVASSSLSQAVGKFGLNVNPDVILSDVNAYDFDAIVFVGGPGASEYWQDTVSHQIIKKAVSEGKVVSAICIAPVTLANAGVLSGKKATVWSSEVGKIGAKGAYYTGNSVEVDGNIVTANGPEAAKDFGKAIVELLKTKY